jgi:hypothetical protein
MKHSENLLLSLREVEQALAAVEQNGVQYIITHEASVPCGGCYTYQRAVRKALAVLRALDLEEPDSVRQS